MVTLFANMFKVSYYEHVMGSLAQKFTNAVAMEKRIEHGVKSGRISTPNAKRGFEGKRKEVDHAEGGYKGRKNPFQNYHTSPKLLTSISTLHFIPENPTLKSNTKKSRNSYPITIALK